jgi:phage terminase large subunit GpA-like protein
VFDFTRRRRRRHVWATFGRSGERPVWQPKAGRSDAHGRAPFHIVGTDKAKLDIFARLGIREPGPGFCHFPAGRDESWFAGLTSERKERVRGKDGRTRIRWVADPSVRNEPLDCRVLAYAAILGLTGMVGRRLEPGTSRTARPAAASRDPDGGHVADPAPRDDPVSRREAALRDGRVVASDTHWGDDWGRGWDDGW